MIGLSTNWQMAGQLQLSSLSCTLIEQAHSANDSARYIELYYKSKGKTWATHVYSIYGNAVE